MKPLNFAIVLMALISCKKVVQETIKPKTLAFDKIIKIATPTTVSNVITYNDKAVPPILINRITLGDMSTWIMADTAGKVIYLAYNINDVTGAISEILFPTTPPFPLDPADKLSWKRCMERAITICSLTNCCTRELYVGCLISWGGACWWKKTIFGSQVPTYTIKKLDKSKLIINLPPIVYK